MAIYIEIEKLKERENTVQYKFSLLNECSGILSINKDSGDVTLIEPLPNKHGENHFARAAYKVKKHWKEGNLPDKTCWAS